LIESRNHALCAEDSISSNAKLHCTTATIRAWDINSRTPDENLMACTEGMINPPPILCSRATDPDQSLSMGDTPIAVERPLQNFAKPHLIIDEGIQGWSRHSKNVNEEAGLALSESSGICLECFSCPTVVVRLSLKLPPKVIRLLGRAGPSAC